MIAIRGWLVSSKRAPRELLSSLGSVARLLLLLLLHSCIRERELALATRQRLPDCTVFLLTDACETNVSQAALLSPSRCRSYHLSQKLIRVEPSHASCLRGIR